MNKNTWIGLGIGLVAGIFVLGLLVKFGPSGLRDFLSSSRQVVNPPSAGSGRPALTTAQSPVRVIGGSITFVQVNGWTSAVAGCTPTGTVDTCSYAASLVGQPTTVSFEGVDASGNWIPGSWTINATWRVDLTSAMLDTGATTASLITLCGSSSSSSTTCGTGNYALLQVTQPTGRTVGFYAPAVPPYQNDLRFFKRYHDPIGCNASAGEVCEHIGAVTITVDGTAVAASSTPCANGECFVTIE